MMIQSSLNQQLNQLDPIEDNDPIEDKEPLLKIL